MQHRADGLELTFSARPSWMNPIAALIRTSAGEDDHGVESVAQQDGDERRGEEHIGSGGC